ncbi:unnamed protein product [Oncorhynchus mykiss]|uniref:Uncharacterized protein n=1 Tax=Oncorhynchus mykiss TaxID=8022 RepID=A0A060XAR8_ONCMY|nr:unnamed protein product [Oncorhynchus mykiss]
MNRSRILRQAKRETPGGEEGNGITVSRSAPGGKEVERQLIGGVEAEAEHGSDTPLNPCFDWECSCVCHLHMPGMKLVWVPIDEEEKEDEKEEEVKLEREEEESRGEGTSLAIKCPPTPPKQTQSFPSHFKASIEEEEESIYETTLPMVDPTPRKICQELDIPLIKVQKTVYWSKLSSSNSEDNTSVQSDSDPSQTQTAEDASVAIPPRVSLAQDKSKTPGHNLMPIPRGGIALPQPTAEEWRSLRPSPPNPSASPIVLHRAGNRVPPPQPPKTGISVHSVKQAIKEHEEDGSAEGEEEDTEEDR